MHEIIETESRERGDLCPMHFLPTTLLGYFTVAGVVSLVGAPLVYIAKKAIDTAAAVITARVLAVKRSRFVEIYGADGSVIKRVKI